MNVMTASPRVLMSLCINYFPPVCERIMNGVINGDDNIRGF